MTFYILLYEDSLEELPDDSSVLGNEFDKVLDLLSWTELDGLIKGRKYKDITEDIILDELRKTTKWATTYRAGYVGENYFIYNILRMKHNNLDQTKEILNDLVENGGVVRAQEEHDGHEFNCLNLIENHEVENQP